MAPLEADGLQGYFVNEARNIDCVRAGSRLKGDKVEVPNGGVLKVVGKLGLMIFYGNVDGGLFNSLPMWSTDEPISIAQGEDKVTVTATKEE